jgi:hypothetical protein
LVDIVGLDIADDGQDEVVGNGVAPVPVEQIVTGQLCDGLRAAQDPESIWMIGKEALSAECKCHLEQIVVFVL